MSVTSRTIPLAQLVPPPEPLRVAMDDVKMAELVDSINKLGLLFPLLVIPKYKRADDTLADEPIAGRHKGPEDADVYEIVDGHRRYLALEQLKIATADSRVFTDLAEAKFAAMLHANVMREDVSAFEEGYQFLELATKYTWSMDQLMTFFRVSEDYINDRVDIVRKDGAVAVAVRDRKIGLGHAKEVLKAEDITTRQILLEQAAVHGATIAALREMRHSLARDAARAQGTLPMNAPAHAEPAAIINPETCCFCGQVDEQYQLVTIRCHSYELADLKAVLDKFSRRAMIEQLKGAS